MGMSRDLRRGHEQDSTVRGGNVKVTLRQREEVVVNQPKPLKSPEEWSVPIAGGGKRKGHPQGEEEGALKTGDRHFYECSGKGLGGY